MGQKLREDKIGTLSHNAGVIGLTNSYVTIGGQQYATGALSRTISTDVTMTANSLYMIYAVLVSGVPVLRISSNVNSAGPAGFNVWKLVGAFYATAATTPAWGSFVTIDGVPSTVTSVNDQGSAQLISAFAGFPSFTLTQYLWSRVGNHLFVTWRMDSTTGNGTSARIPLPRGGIITVENSYPVGTYAGQNAAVNAGGGSIIGLGSTDMGFATGNLSGAAISTQTGSAVVGTSPTTLAGTLRATIAQWSSTPLKDL